MFSSLTAKSRGVLRTFAPFRTAFSKADLEAQGIRTASLAVHRNPPVSTLYRLGLAHDKGTSVVSTGAFCAYSGAKTGRSPGDKRVVHQSPSDKDVWWGPVNKPLSPESFELNRSRAVDYLSTRDRLYVIDGFAGADERYRVNVRVVTSLAYHALFMHNMLIRPTPEELEDFTPDFHILNAGAFPAGEAYDGVGSKTSVNLNIERNELVILGTEYAGEMKKGVFTLMHYLMPKQGQLSLHASANTGPEGDVTVFFGLSGTGKTTLSADAQRRLIGDDEHVWTDRGVFNIEGGCYAKADGLSYEREPEIWDAIKFGTVLENVVVDPATDKVDFDDLSITANTRVSYPLDYIPNAVIPSVAGHPKNLLLLTADASGVLPPVSRLSREQAQYLFISGYTSKTPGTEVGITEPEATFSACFGAPFLVYHPAKYAGLLADRLAEHSADAWLINTGWTGGKFGTGKRMSLKHTRAILDAIHDGSLAKEETDTMPVFGLHVPKKCNGVPSEILNPRDTWPDKAKYDAALQELAKKFKANMQKFEVGTPEEVLAAGPKI